MHKLLLRYIALLIGISVIALYGCSKNESTGSTTNLSYAHLKDVQPTIVPKDKFETITIEEVFQQPIDEIIDNNEIELLSKDGFLVIKSLTRFEGSHLISVFDTDSLTLQKELAPYGVGPDEFTDARIVQSHEDGIVCYVVSVRNKKLYRLTDGLTLEYVATIPTTTNDRNFSMGYDAIEFLGRDTILTTQQAGDLLGICSISLADSVASGIVALDFTNDFNGWWPVYLGSSTYNGQIKKFAFASTFYDQLFISDLLGKDVVLIRGTDFREINTKTKSDFWESGRNVGYYTDIFSDDQNIYALYRGVPYNPAFGKNDSFYLEVHSWSGEPIKRFQLPTGMQFPKGAIATQSDGRRVVYLVNIDEDEFLYKFTLPD